jgi:subtilisin family serine protease
MRQSRVVWARRLAVPALAAATALSLTMATPAAAEGTILGAGARGAISDSYLVVLKERATTMAAVGPTAVSLSERYGGTVTATWRHALRGYAARMTERQARRLAADPAVAVVEQNRVVRIADTQQNPPSWGLDRIDQRDRPLDNAYTYPNTASTVHAYVIDTGIRTTHRDFGGRATWGTNTVGGANTDCNGHGTHVAGTVGGSAHGVAKGVRLVAVKSLDCQGSGSVQSIVSAVDWVTANAVKPAVANMSLGGGASTAMDNAVRNSIASGIVYSIASGNSNANACGTSPARVAEALTVNASTNADSRASFSNFGTCTDLFAPGQDITSAWHTSDTATNTISGTSMAAPHVAGVVALHLSANPSATVPQTNQAVIDRSSQGKIGNPGTGSPNRLLFVQQDAPADVAVTNPGGQTGTVGSPASLQLAATGGTPPYTWSATGLPAGLTLSPSTGRISGTPTTANTHQVTVTATDAGGRSGSAAFGWTVEPDAGSDLIIANPGTLTGAVGVEAGVKLTVSGGSGPYTWTVDGLPPGLPLDTDGSDTAVINGVPTAAGAYRVTASATGATGGSTAIQFDWVVTGGGGQVTVPSPGDQTSTAGTAVTLRLSASGGAAPYTWSATGLPAGLSISSDGLVSGTPTAAGTSTVTVTATDSASVSGTATFSWRVDPSGGGTAWAPWTAYAAGATVTFEGATYRCLQPHTSQPGWTPAAVPALWQRL